MERPDIKIENFDDSDEKGQSVSYDFEIPVEPRRKITYIFGPSNGIGSISHEFIKKLKYATESS